jgi:tRNA A37 threonylcarbamoyladenosine dehydratase
VLPDNIGTFSLEDFDFVIDAIDTVSAKIAIIETTLAVGTPSVSCMGTGNKLDPTAFCVTDISKTNTCPLARVMRRELKKRGITHARVIYSTEEAITPKEALEDRSRRSVPGSLSFVPSVAGLIAASEAVKSILKGEKKNG